MRSVCVCVLVLTAHPKPLLDSLTQVHARFLLVLLENNHNLASFFKVLTQANLSSKFRGPLAMILRSTGQSATKQHKRSNRGSNVSILAHTSNVWMIWLLLCSSIVLSSPRSHAHQRESVRVWLITIHREGGGGVGM